METIVIIGRVLLFVWLLVFPQLVGLLLFFRLRRLPSWCSRFLAAVTPAMVYFFVAIPYWFAGMKEARARGEYICGLAVMAVVTLLFSGTIFQLLVGAFVQALLARRSKIINP